jgi:hypothetical protein
MAEAIVEASNHLVHSQLCRHLRRGGFQNPLAPSTEETMQIVTHAAASLLCILTIVLCLIMLAAGPTFLGVV